MPIIESTTDIDTTIDSTTEFDFLTDDISTVATFPAEDKTEFARISISQISGKVRNLNHI